MGDISACRKILQLHLPLCPGICGKGCGRLIFFGAALASFAMFFPAWPLSAALAPEEVLVVVNRNVAEGLDLARYYMRERGVPKGNLLRVEVPDRELCSREIYNRDIATPVRRFLESRELAAKLPAIRCLLLFYGMPLKVGSTALTVEEKRDRERLKKRLEAVKAALAAADEEKKTPIKREYADLRKKLKKYHWARELAALDSELALVLASPYKLEGWVLNPDYIGYRGHLVEGMPDHVLMTVRLDGPEPGVVRRIIRDSVAAEKRGLSGTAYFDARWPRPSAEKRKQLKGYAFYDNSLYLAADQVKRFSPLRVVVNDKPQLFQPGECPQAVLYCGWYRKSHYLDAFDWQPGAVAYHIASSELATLRKEKSEVWGKMMLEDGAAAVIGPVAEPYVQAFPPPALFFTLLLRGNLTLAEVFSRSVPWRSWRMVLVGDPLYRPRFTRLPGGTR